MAMDLKDVMSGKKVPTPEQNLINPAKADSARPAGFWKSMVLDFLSIGSALLFGYTYYRYLATGLNPWYLLGALLFFCSCSVMQVFLAKEISRRLLVIFAEALAFVAFFIGTDEWQIVVSAGIAVTLFLFWGFLSSRSRARNSLDIQFFGITKSVLSNITTAALLFMLLVYAPQAAGEGIPIARANFKTFFDWSSGFLDNFYPNIPLNDSFAGFSQNVAEMELKNNPTYQALPPDSQTTVVTQASAQIANNVTQMTGITPKPGDQVSDVVYDYLVAAFANWQSHFQDKFVIFWLIALFLVLRTFGIVFVWAAQFIAVIFYEILIASGFMHIAQVAQTKETVEY